MQLGCQELGKGGNIFYENASINSQTEQKSW